MEMPVSFFTIAGPAQQKRVHGPLVTPYMWLFTAFHRGDSKFSYRYSPLIDVLFVEANKQCRLPH